MSTVNTTDKATFAIGMQDDVSGPAGEAANALRKLKSEIDGDNTAIGQLNKQLTNLKKASTPNEAEIARLTKQLQKHRDSLAATQTKYLALGGTFEKTRPKVSAFKARLDELTKSAGATGGPLATLASGLGRLVTLIGGGAVAAVVGLAAVFIALGYAVGRAGLSLAEYAIRVKNAREAELTQLEAAGKLRTAYSLYYGLHADKASDMQAAIDRVSAAVSDSRDKVAGYAMSLERAGVRGANFEKSLLAVATASSATGEEQANWVKAYAAGLSLTGQSVDKLAARIKAQYGGIVRQKMLDLTVQAQKLKESEDALFNGVDITPLKNARKAFNDLFAQSTVSGRYLKDLMGRITQPFIDGLVWALKVAKDVFLDLLIWEVKLEIAYYKLRNAFRRVGEAFDALGKRDLTDMSAGVAAFAAPFVAVAYALKFLNQVISTTDWGKMATSFDVLSAPVLGAVGAVQALIDVIGALFDLDWDAIGSGIATAFEHFTDDLRIVFVKGLKNIAHDGWVVFKDELGIHSPSRVFAELGKQIPAGLVVGIEAGKGDVDASVAHMVSIPALPESAPKPAPAAAPKGGASSGTTVNIRELNVNAGGGTSRAEANDIAEQVKRALENILEGVSIQVGAPA